MRPPLEGDKIVLDPDREVQGAVRMVFDLFECRGTAYGSVRRFREFGLRFPRPAYGVRIGRLVAPLGEVDIITGALNPHPPIYHPVALRAAGGLARGDPRPPRTLSNRHRLGADRTNDVMPAIAIVLLMA
jgi:hypothetical protein